MYLWKTWVYLKFASNLPSEITSSLKKCSKAISVKRLMKAENHPIIQALKKYFFLSDVCKVNIYKEWTDAITLTPKHLRIDTETDFVNKCSKLLYHTKIKTLFPHNMQQWTSKTEEEHTEGSRKIRHRLYKLLDLKNIALPYGQCFLVNSLSSTKKSHYSNWRIWVISWIWSLDTSTSDMP